MKRTNKHYLEFNHEDYGLIKVEYSIVWFIEDEDWIYDNLFIECVEPDEFIPIDELKTYLENHALENGYNAMTPYEGEPNEEIDYAD